MKNRLSKTEASNSSLLPSHLLNDIKDLILEARSAVAATVNATITILYWRIGIRIQQEVLNGKRAEYGEQIVSTLSRQLVEEFGSGFSTKNLLHMVRFAKTFPDEPTVSTLWRLLSWSHFKIIIYLKDPLQQEFYTQMCRLEGWSVRTLRSKIDSMLRLVRETRDRARRSQPTGPDPLYGRCP